jgi:hypothetical protein
MEVLLGTRPEHRQLGELQCQYPAACENERAIKRNGERHWLCEIHRDRQNRSQRNRHRRVVGEKKRKGGATGCVMGPRAAASPPEKKRKSNAVETASRSSRVQAGAESLPQSLAPVREARRSSEKRSKTRKTTKANLPGVSRTATPVAKASSSQLPEDAPAREGWFKTYSQCAEGSDGGKSAAGENGNASRAVPATHNSNGSAPCSTRNEQPTHADPACPAGHAAHAVIVVVQALPISCIADDGLQPASSTAESSVFSTVFQAITKMLAVQPCAQHRSEA